MFQPCHVRCIALYIRGSPRQEECDSRLQVEVRQDPSDPRSKRHWDHRTVSESVWSEEREKSEDAHTLQPRAAYSDLSSQHGVGPERRHRPERRERAGVSGVGLKIGAPRVGSRRGACRGHEGEEGDGDPRRRVVPHLPPFSSESLRRKRSEEVPILICMLDCNAPSSRARSSSPPSRQRRIPRAHLSARSTK